MLLLKVSIPPLLSISLSLSLSFPYSLGTIIVIICESRHVFRQGESTAAIRILHSTDSAAIRGTALGVRHTPNTKTTATSANGVNVHSGEPHPPCDPGGVIWW